MKNFKILKKILKITGVYKIIMGFIAFVLLTSVVFTIIEPNINNYLEAIWYSFSVFSSIGFGDIIAVTLIGRILTIMLSIYGVFVFALIPGIFASLYWEVLKIKSDEISMDILYKLENLPNLSKEELVEISEKLKNRKK